MRMIPSLDATIATSMLTLFGTMIELTAQPPEVAEYIAQTYRNVETRYIGAGIHFIQEDHPHVIGRNLSDWLRDRVVSQP